MRCIFDTHTLIWTLTDDTRLSSGAKSALYDYDEVMVSIASLWEIAIKLGLGKLEFDRTLEQVARECEAIGIDMLPIAPTHLDAVRELPPIHKDPFDRLIVAQAMCEGASVVTKDVNIAGYEVETIW